MKKLVISTLFVMQVFIVFAQSPTGISGKIVDAKTQKPLQNVVASIQNTNFTQLTNADGKFSFEKVTVGNQLLQIRSTGFKDQLLTVEIISGKMIDLGVVSLQEDQSFELQSSLVTITESDLSDDNSGSENTSSLLQASRDVFQQSAAFNWGQARFRIRGLDSEYSNTMINGVSMNKASDGRPQWSNWGGLNDATRNQEFTVGSGPSDYTFGGILGTQEINTRASIFRPGSRISASGTNTNYTGRLMGTVVSGMDKYGWAYAISAGRRWATEGYFDGTNYAANSFFASVEKKINDHHSLNFTSIYAQNSRAKNSPTSDEVASLAGAKYNSYWGWQDEEKRNSRVKNVEEPIFMLSHYWKINDKNKLNTNVTYQFGAIGNSRIDFQGANSPDPTYYRNLPSYWTSIYAVDQGENPGAFTPDYANGAIARANFIANPQMDWNAMYRANSTAILDANGNEIGRTPSVSKYVLYEDRADDKTFTANTILNSQINDNIVLNAGATYRKLKSANFQLLLDLLGGTHFNDFDTFGATSDQQQSDLNNPNRQINKNDKYGYNYNMFADVIDAFTQFKFTYKKVDFYLAQSFSSSTYQREGLYKNGYYPTNSYGKSDKTTFENFGFKGGLTYKITGKHYLNFNAAHMTKAPSLRNTYPNARLNNNIVSGIVSENISSADASYVFRGPKIKAKATVYFSKIKNATETSFYYADGIFGNDDATDTNDSNAFVSETVTNISKKNIGAELGFEYQITSTIKLTTAAAFGQYTYDNNPTVLITNDARATIDNTNPVTNFGVATMKNYRQAGMPQQAYSFGVEYRDPKFWNIGANINYLADNYLDISPIMRTSNFFINPATGFNFPEATIEKGRELLKQEKFDPISLLNIIGGKSWRIDNKTLGFFASINNVLDVTYKTGGFEQARNANFRQLNQDVSSATPAIPATSTSAAVPANYPAFAPKYFYGYGRTYFVNLYLNF
ncbi:MAG: TonB-dependent receptor [Flavobacteriaceae bacterium]|nr:TonB-dependent receptor [Flavobacteriaceae bacterium]